VRGGEKGGYTRFGDGKREGGFLSRRKELTSEKKSDKEGALIHLVRGNSFFVGRKGGAIAKDARTRLILSDYGGEEK